MNRDSTSGPTVADYELEGRDGEAINVRARLLGFATSHREVHSHLTNPGSDGAPTTFAVPHQRCHACRWFEVRLYAVDSELSPEGEPQDRRGRYLVLTSGMSAVPGEVIMRRSSWTDSAYEVIELLTQRRSERPYLPAPSARVLSQAAAWDAAIRDAYVDRAVI